METAFCKALPAVKLSHSKSYSCSEWVHLVIIQAATEQDVNRISNVSGLVLCIFILGMNHDITFGRNGDIMFFPGRTVFGSSGSDATILATCEKYDPSAQDEDSLWAINKELSGYCGKTCELFYASGKNLVHYAGTFKCSSETTQLSRTGFMSLSSTVSTSSNLFVALIDCIPGFAGEGPTFPLCLQLSIASCASSRESENQEHVPARENQHSQSARGTYWFQSVVDGCVKRSHETYARTYTYTFTLRFRDIQA